MLTAAVVAPYVDEIFRRLVDAMPDMWRDLQGGTAVNVARRRTALPSGVRLQEMGGALVFGGRHLVGTKTYVSDGGFPASTGFIHLYDAAAGVPLVVLASGTWGALRTAAASGVFIRLLAPPDTRVAAVIGTGPQAVWQVRGLALLRPDLDEIRICARSLDSAARFCDVHRSQVPVRLRPVDSPATAVAGAGIVVTATDSAVPVLSRRDLDEDVHISAVGANRPAKRELGTDVVEAAALVVVDDLVQARSEAGDLLAAAADGGFDWSRARSGGQVLDDVATPPRGISVFESQGMGIQDLLVAAVAHEVAAGAAARKEAEIVG